MKEQIQTLDINYKVNLADFKRGTSLNDVNMFYPITKFQLKFQDEVFFLESICFESSNDNNWLLTFILYHDKKTAKARFIAEVREIGKLDLMKLDFKLVLIKLESFEIKVIQDKRIT